MINFPHLDDPPGGEIDPGNTIDLTIDQILSRYPNWQFEPNLRGWEKTGTAFDNQPTYGNNVMMNRGAIPVWLPLRGSYWRKTFYPIGQKGLCWVGTFDARPSHNQSIPIGTTQGDGPTGTLTSKPFTINTNYITFLIGGGKDLANLKVELLRAGPTGFVPVTGTARTGMNSEVFRREWWDVRALRGQEARIRITDNASGPWGHINADDFRFQDTAPPDTKIYIGDNRGVPQVVEHLIHPGVADSRAYIDYDAPVWGVADLHAHPASHLGFGATFDDSDEHEINQMGIFWGKPGGAYTAASSTIAADLAPCDPKTHGAEIGDPISHLVRMTVLGSINGITGYPHASGGWPDFRNWPSAYSIQHQQMHITWIRRAYEGGLRLMIASVTDNQTFNLLWEREYVIGHTPVVSDPDFDKPKARKMLNFIKELALQNAAWMEVVTEPKDARRAIRQGKLALILGLEMDQLTADDILELMDDGVRHVIPIHLADNQFGGCAVFNDLFNSHNFILNGNWLSVKGDRQLSFRLGRPKFIVDRGPGGVEPREIEEGEYRALRYECNDADPAPGCIPDDQGHRNARPTRAAEFERLIKAGLMVDLAHMSQDAQEEALQLSERFGYPLNNSHTSLRPDSGGEDERRMRISSAARMAAQGGVLGLSTGVKPKTIKLASIQPRGHSTVAYFENENRTWTISKRRAPADWGYNQLNLILHVGSDDLEEGIPGRLLLGMRDGTSREFDLNYGAKWDAETVHRVPVDLGGDFPLENIHSMTVRGAAPLKNWTLNRLEVRPARVLDLFPPSPSLDFQFNEDRLRLSLPAAPPPAGSDLYVGALDVTIQTGVEALNRHWRAEAVIELLDRPELHVTLAEGTRLESNSTHSWNIPISPPILRSKIMQFSIQVFPSGLTSSDEWDIHSLRVRTVLHEGIWVDLSGLAGKPLARFSSNQPEYQLYAGDDISAEQGITRLGLAIRTGEGEGDAMRSSSRLYANLMMKDGRVFDFLLKEEGYRWLKNSFYIPIIGLPEGTKRLDIDAIRLTYQPDAPVFTDNWSVSSFEVEAYPVDENPVGRWVDSYLGALEVMDWRGIGLGTDMNGFVSQVPFTSPGNAITYSTDGTGSALVQHRTGTRAWDFNRDGLAHYGMLPDFFEAISLNSAMTFENMSPLFQSAEAVIQMWENSKRAALVARALTLPPGEELAVGLRSIEQVFLHAGADGSLLSSRSPDSRQEMFRLTRVRDQFVALHTASGKYVTALGGQSQEVRADATSRGPAETFGLVPCGGSRVGLRTRDNRFINLRGLHPGGPVTATSVVAKGWAVFELVPLT